MQNKIKNFLVLSLIAIGLFSCTKDFESINENTKSPKEVNPKYLLPTAQSMAMNHYFSDGVNSIVTGVLSQHFSQPSYAEESNYSFRDGLLDNNIGDFFVAVANLREINKLISGNSSEYSAAQLQAWNLITITMEAFCMQNITDVNGPAIYSKGFDVFTTPIPEYDSQEEIYTALLSKLAMAVENISDADVDMKLGSQDIVYNGDVKSWVRFANSMILRLAMRVSDVDDVLAQKYFAIAINPVNGGVITSNNENALYIYHEYPTSNQFHSGTLNGTKPGVVPSNTLCDILIANSDPRYGMYCSDEWGPALEYGTKDFSWNKNTTIINYKLISGKKWKDQGHPYGDGPADLPGIFIDYAGVEFFLAEAALRGYANAGDAKTHYNNAISASIEYYADFLGTDVVSNDTINDYLSQPEVDLDQVTTVDEKLKRIGREKWVALYLQGGESWAEARRLDAPVFNVPVGKTEADIPMRLKFSSREWTLNSDNVQDAVTMLKSNSDDYATKLWWDTK